MAKKFFMALLLVFLFAANSYAQTSQDVYVRQDVFDAKMEALFERLHAEIADFKTEIRTELSDFKTEIRTELSDFKTEIKSEIADLRTEMADLRTELKGEISELRTEIADLRTEVKTEIAEVRGDIKGLGGRIDGLSGRIDGLEHDVHSLERFIYWVIGIAGLIFAVIAVVPEIKKFLQSISAPQLTAEDVRRIIQAELNQLNQRPQA